MSSLNSKIVQLDDILLSLSQSIESLNVDAKRTPVHCAPISLQAKHHRKGSHDALLQTEQASLKDSEMDRRSRLALLAKWKTERDAKRAQRSNSFSSISTAPSSPASIQSQQADRSEHGWHYYDPEAEDAESASCRMLYPESSDATTTTTNSSSSSSSHPSLQRWNTHSLRILFYFPSFLHSSHFSNSLAESHFASIAQASPSHFSHFASFEHLPFSTHMTLSTTPVSSCRSFIVGSSWTVGALLDRFVAQGVLIGPASDWAVIERLALSPMKLERRLGLQEYWIDLIEKSEPSHLYCVKMPNENEAYHQSIASLHRLPFSFWSHMKTWPNGKWKQRWIQFDSHERIASYKKEKATQGQSICEDILDAHFYIAPPTKATKGKPVIAILDTSLTLWTMKNLTLARDWMTAIQGLKERRMERERILSSTVLLAEAASEKESGMIGRSRKERLLAHRTLMKEKYRASMFTFEDWRRQLSSSTTNVSEHLNHSKLASGRHSTTSMMMMSLPHHMMPMDQLTNSLRASLHAQEPCLDLSTSHAIEPSLMKNGKNLQGGQNHWFRRLFRPSKSKSKSKSHHEKNVNERAQELTGVTSKMAMKASTSILALNEEDDDEEEEEHPPRRQGSLTLRTNEPFIQKYENRE